MNTTLNKSASKLTQDAAEEKAKCASKLARDPDPSKCASKLTQDPADEKAVGAEKKRGKISASLGFMGPDNARGRAGVEAELERREFVSGVDDDGSCLSQETVA